MVKGEGMFETLRTEVDGASGRLTLDRPDRLNPLSITALAEIAQAACWFDRQPKVIAASRLPV